MRAPWRTPLVGIVITTMVSTAGCAPQLGDNAGKADDQRIDVVASFYPLAQLAERVGGGRVRVENLTPPGVEPHDLELTSAQVDGIEDADVVVLLGSGFQPAVDKAAARRRSAPLDASAGVGLVMGAAEAIEAEEGGAEPEESGGHSEESAALDPHFWLDPLLLARAIDGVQEALTKAAPGSADEFEENAAALRADLDRLDARFREGLANCVRRDVVTSHAAFHYLTARYGLTQRPITGLSPESEPDPGRLAELTALIRREGITTVFYEELVPQDLADTLARESGAQTAVLSPLEGLSADEREAGKNYFTVMQDNLTALRTALDCS